MCTYSTCSCDDPKDQVLTCTCDGSGCGDSVTRPCKLDTACPGVAESAPVTVTVGLTGDGLWDWVEANLESFKVSFVADVVTVGPFHSTIRAK